MTDYNKWDKIVAELSDDEEAAAVPDAVLEEPSLPEVRPGYGNALRPDGFIQHLEWRPGNARGNAMSTNADIQYEFHVDQYEWDEAREPGTVFVEVPLKPLGTVLQEKVKCAYTDVSFSLIIETEERQRYKLVANNLPCGGIMPEGSAFRVDTAGGKSQLSTNTVSLQLTKRQPDSTWGGLGSVLKDVKRPITTITDYSWADFKRACKVWIKVPGVHHLAPEQVKSRFRELSFDITVSGLDGKDFQFAITELPMEVVVAECYHEVMEDQVKIFLRKWAKTGWFKLTNLDGR